MDPPPVNGDPFNVKALAFIVPFTSKSADVKGVDVPMATRLSGLPSVSKYTTEESSFFFQRISNFVSHAKSFSESAVVFAVFHASKVVVSKY